ncbi:amino acid ABC transporter substrate-binding protein [Pseudorhodoferax sp. Leaf267]|uniref:amino acid ABC transporter substrate-binding protein n=1 Tax=Pseudorhodoferax sp. Leaf267 TaxID=1736316 RepID=UPI0006F93980|nr:amino acid ABC transporter substrate-binding protein [Pseudorhodoferax sp. Leaf267]KQP18511.1 amino acid ABC transporter substrate-binding protein [Pseudorhodoferax sp. Leaf267]
MAHAILRTALLAACAAALPATAQAGPTLDAVRAAGALRCGVSTGLLGFSHPDANGQWAGMDVDVCRAVAAAVLGSADKVRYVPLDVSRRLPSLQAGEIDILSFNTTFTMSRDAAMGVQVTTPTYYDGQGFMVPLKSRIKSTRQLQGQTVCVRAGNDTERTLREFSRANRLNLKLITFTSSEDVHKAYMAGECTATSNDASGLASVRKMTASDPAAHVILNELISKEPLGPMVRRGDDAWASIVKWTVYGLIAAEEHGITQANVGQQKGNANPEVLRMLGHSEDTGKLLGLDREWLVRAIGATGNYGEMFARNMGPDSPLGLPRGLNAQWQRGGLMYAMPIR